MSLCSRIEVVITMKKSGMIPVFYNGDIQMMKEVLKACYEGATRVFEYTNRGEGAHNVFEELNIWAKQHLPEMILGVGSIVDAPTAGLYIQLGAKFIVSPLINPDVAKVCNRRKILWIPGCGTLTEIGNAEELGAEIVKIFPGSTVGGAEFVKAIKGPCPWTSVMPTGGVDDTRESLKKWFDAGVICVGMGSNLFTKEIIQKKSWNEIKDKCKNIYQIIDSIRNNTHG